MTGTMGPTGPSGPAPALAAVTGATGPTGPAHAQALIHYDPVRVDYTVTDGELIQLQSAAANPWKDVTLAAITLGLPCLLNAVGILVSQVEFKVTFAVFANSLVGLVSIGFAIGFGVAWRRSRTSLSSVMEAIKRKPKTVISFDQGTVHAQTQSATSAQAVQPVVPAPTNQAGPKP